MLDLRIRPGRANLSAGKTTRPFDTRPRALPGWLPIAWLPAIGLATLLAGSLVLPSGLPPVQAAEPGFRLLKLDGHKVKWGEPRLGTGATISYAFVTQAMHFDQARNCADLGPIDTLTGDHLSMAQLAEEAAAAFLVWERAADLSFHPVSDPATAQILIGAQGQPTGRAFANVRHAIASLGEFQAIEQALVCLNPDHDWKVGFDGNKEVYDIRYTLVHEIGHAIGLDHPGASGQVMGFRYTESFTDLQAGDLRGARLLYGPPVNDERSQDDPVSIAGIANDTGRFLGIGSSQVSPLAKPGPMPQADDRANNVTDPHPRPPQPLP